MPVLLAFGDSNTHGTKPMASFGARARYARHIRWPGVAEAALGAGWSVIEEGLPGRTTVHDDPTAGPHRNGLSVLPALLDSHGPLDAVAVMLGTNDCKAAFGVTPLDIALSLERLARVIRASECGPGRTCPPTLVVAPPWIEEIGWLGELFAGAAAKSRALAPRYAQVAQRTGAAFLDLAPLVRPAAEDGVHLTAEAHAIVGAAVARAVAGLVPTA